MPCRAMIGHQPADWYIHTASSIQKERELCCMTVVSDTTAANQTSLHRWQLSYADCRDASIFALLLLLESAVHI